MNTEPQIAVLAAAPSTIPDRRNPAADAVAFGAARAALETLCRESPSAENFAIHEREIVRDRFTLWVTGDDGAVVDGAFLRGLVAVSALAEFPPLALQVPGSQVAIRPDRIEVSFNGRGTARTLDDLGRLISIKAECTRLLRDADDGALERVATLDSTLWTLNLTEAKVTDEGLATLRKFDAIGWLSLSSTNIGDAGLRHVADAKELVELDLDETRVGDSGLDSLVDLPLLEFLNLEGTKVTDAGLPLLARMVGLRGLNLNRTAVTDVGLAALATLRFLESLSLEETGVTQAGVDRLQRHLPECNIYAGL